mmetsp:Transcript_21136/g.51047  ORF Transcript_21136/g.51047 Transcript_21136/m.51047 type:complete len:92 (+) Transcript_21136:4442-4717(+)
MVRLWLLPLPDAFCHDRYKPVNQEPRPEENQKKQHVLFALSNLTSKLTSTSTLATLSLLATWTAFPSPFSSTDEGMGALKGSEEDSPFVSS